MFKKHLSESRLFMLFMLIKFSRKKKKNSPDNLIYYTTVYRMPGPFGTFIDDFILLIKELPTQHRILNVSDFNLDKMLVN